MDGDAPHKSVPVVPQRLALRRVSIRRPNEFDSIQLGGLLKLTMPQAGMVGECL